MNHANLNMYIEWLTKLASEKFLMAIMWITSGHKDADLGHVSGRGISKLSLRQKTCEGDGWFRRYYPRCDLVVTAGMTIGEGAAIALLAIERRSGGAGLLPDLVTASAARILFVAWQLRDGIAKL